jgi:WD40 repeat protein
MAFADGAHVEVFEIATGRRLGSFDTPECDYPSALALSSDAHLAAAGGSDGAVVLHDVATGDVVATLPGHRAMPAWLAFSADGRTLVSAAETILVWDVALATGR